MELILTWLNNHNYTGAGATLTARSIAVVIVIALACLANFLVKHLLLRLIARVSERTKTQWDDILLKERVFHRLSHLAPGLVIYKMATFVGGFNQVTSNTPPTATTLTAAIEKGAGIYMALVGLLVLDALLNAVVEIYRTYEFSRKIPIRGFIQGIKIVLFTIAGIVIISIILGKSPSVLLGSLGAMTAILLLIFKDSILGLVAGIQLSANKMIHIGDWIEMPKFGADGDVIDISLTTVKVQNWDKTISTIPTYALISDTFKNWRGMSESGGRRIKRHINLDMTSIQFCDEAMLERFKRIQYIKDYLAQKEAEIQEHNRGLGIETHDRVNGRRLTNVGTFRAYIVEYLRHHPKIHPNMTFLVRQLQSSNQGLPIEIYVFSNDQVWANYEAIQADIFDHILAVIPEFELRVFQDPTGSDWQTLLQNKR